MKCTDYFLATRERTDRAVITLEWIEIATKNPVKEEIQSDGRIRRWSYIAEEQ